MRRLALLALLFACEAGDGAKPIGAPMGPAEPGIAGVETNVSGLVVEARSGRPLGGARVTALPGTAEATTAPDGSYRLRVSAGPYAIHAALAGYLEAQVNVTATADRGVVADLALERARPVLEVPVRTLDLGASASMDGFVIRNVGPAGTSLEVSIPPLEPWIRCEPRTATVAAGREQRVGVSIDRDRLPGFGAFSALVPVLTNGGEAFVNLRALREDPQRPHLAYEYEVFDFGLVDAERTLSIENDGRGMLMWSVSTDLVGLTIDPASGTLGTGERARLTLRVDRAGRAPGADFDGLLSFTSNSVVDDALPLRAHYATPHVYGWNVPAAPIDLGEERIDHAVRLENTSSDSLDWSSAWGHAFVRVFPARGRILAGQSLTAYVVVNRGITGPGPFSSNVRFMSRVSTVSVSLSGLNASRPIFEYTRDVHVQWKGAASAGASVFVTNVGSGTIDWSATSTTPWIVLPGPTSGTVDNDGCVTVGRGLEDCGDAIPLRVDRAAFAAPGTYRGSVRLTDRTANRSHIVPVRVGVRDFRFEPLAAPPQASLRVGAAGAFDEGRDRVVVFGGTGASTRPGFTGPLLDDTWEHDGSTWRELASPVRPAARVGHAMAYDPMRQAVVMLGGRTSLSVHTLAEDTWELAAGWTRTASVGAPIPVGLQPLAFDPRTRRLAVYGSRAGGCAFGVPPPDLGIWWYANGRWALDPDPRVPKMCSPRLIAWQGELVLHEIRTTAPYYATFVADAALGWRARDRLPIGAGADPVVRDPRTDLLYALSGGPPSGSNYVTVLPTLRLGYPPTRPEPSFEVHRLEGFWYQFSQGTSPGLLTELPFVKRHGHVVVFDTTRGRVLTAFGQCLDTSGYSGARTDGQPCADAWALVPSLR